MNAMCYSESGGLISVEQAQDALREAIQPIPEFERIDIRHAKNRVLTTSVYSSIAIPPQRIAAMDGYAFSSQKLPEKNTADTLTLNVVGTALAGRPFEGELNRGECVRILTGAVVPDSADSVIAQEDVERYENNIQFNCSAPYFRNIRAAGSDVALGDVLIDAPKKLNARDLALLASAGVSHVDVRRPIKIAFFSTGDELVDVRQTLKTGQIYDSNRYLLSGLLSEAGHLVNDFGVIADQPEQIERLLNEVSANHDLVISSGGASVGDADFIKQVLERCGQINFWKVAIKPGKPLTFGRIDRCWYLGLPGNPVAVWVTYEQFVKVALQRLAGAPETRKLRLPARCLDKLRKAPGREEFQRGVLRQSDDGEFIVSVAGGQDSHQMRSASRANCLIVLDSGCNGVDIGETVWVEPLSIEL